MAVFILGSSSCNNSSEPPYPDDSNAIAGSRDYVWQADTIKNPFIYLRSIWGNSTNNLWATGDLASGALYRYDGIKWYQDNRVYISDPQGIWGFGDQVWVGNDQGSIWKFSGNSIIQQVKDFTIEGQLITFPNMAGSSETEIYAAGDVLHKSLAHLMKYDGTKWNLDKVLGDLGGFMQIKYIPKEDKYYMVSNFSDYSLKIYEYDRQSFKLLLSYPPTNIGPTIAEIDGYLYAVIDKKIFRYYKGRDELIFEINLPNFGGVIWGRNRNDIFVRMLDGLAHFDGKDVKYLFKTSNNIMMAPNMVIFEKDVFIPCKDYTKNCNIVYHGKLL